MTNPPMQCNRTSRATAESSSRRKESHGSGDHFKGRCRQDVPPSSRSGDSNARPGANGFAGAKLFLQRSWSRDRMYLRARAVNPPEAARVVEVLARVGYRAWSLLRPWPEKQQTQV